MNYIENIFVCMVAPLLVAVPCARGRGRQMIIFFLSGMLACLLSSYISTYIAAIRGADLFSASIEIAPFVEECIKLFPVVFFLLVFEPNMREAADNAIMTAVGFATFENVCFMVENSAGDLWHLAIRGFSTGAMHVVCALFIIVGIYKLWDTDWLRAAGMLALLAITITFHGVYNILVSQPGIVAAVGYAVPVITAAIVLVVFKKRNNQIYGRL